MPDARELLASYQDALKGLRRGVGPAGALIAPLQAGADLMGQVLHGQEALEKQVDATLLQLETLFQLARDAPATLRTQATAFTAAAVAFEQAAQVMNAQADLLERTGAALSVPARVIRGR